MTCSTVLGRRLSHLPVALMSIGFTLIIISKDDGLLKCSVSCTVSVFSLTWYVDWLKFNVMAAKNTG